MKVIGAKIQLSNSEHIYTIAERNNTALSPVYYSFDAGRSILTIQVSPWWYESRQNNDTLLRKTGTYSLSEDLNPREQLQ